MARPQSTSGGRPHVLSLRLSDHEVAALDAARGTMKRHDYLRSLIPNAERARVYPGEPTMLDQHIVESPLTEQMPEVPTVEAAPVSTNALRVVPALHRHKRGTLIETKWVKGQKVNSYRCADLDCTYVMED